MACSSAGFDAPGDTAIERAVMTKTREELLGIYSQADRDLKGKILDQICLHRGFHRKYAIRWLASWNAKRKEERLSRRLSRINKLEHVLVSIWQASGRMCSRRLRSAVPLWLDGYKTSHNRNLDPELLARIRKMSPATIDRYVAKRRALAQDHRERSLTPPFSDSQNVMNEIWKIDSPGYVHLRIVRLKDNNSVLLVLFDKLTSWCTALVSNAESADHISTALRKIEADTPFEIRAVHVEATENCFLTSTRKAFFHRNNPVPVSFSLARIEPPAASKITALESRCALHNYFLPTIRNDGSCKTPAQRLLGSPISEAQKARLQADTASNPFDHSMAIYQT